MKNNKKSTSTLPKNIQLTFVTAAAIALVMNAIYYIGLLLRVYPQGMRLSQFSVMAITLIVLPALLFVIAYVVYKKGSSQLERFFNATLLATVGLAIHTIILIIERLLTQHYDIYTGMPVGTWIPLVSVSIAVASYLVILLTLSSPKKNPTRCLQLTAVALVVVAFIANAIFNISSLVLQHVDSDNVTNLLTNPLLITPVVLPIAFFATAYLTASKANGRLSRLFTAVVYTLVGTLAIWITTVFFNLGIWTLSIGDAASVHALDLPTIFTAFLSLAVYTFLIVTHNRTTKKKATKK
ncbi:MAG: hypothetical protein JWM07_513 [Candidatus Saccharibacteria bacterium]|nr:hypothetical protein [Candidatus Saccharibacteria bacterium]